MAPKKSTPGRPASGIPTEAFCCRAPSSMVEAFECLADVRGSVRPGTELIRAAEEHLIHWYRVIKANQKSPLVSDPTGSGVSTFLSKVEEWLKQTKRWPLGKAHD